MKEVSILKEDIIREDIPTKKLTSDCHFVTRICGMVDVVRGVSMVKIFDHYYDKYKKALKWLKQTEGTVRPNLWNAAPPKRKKRKKPSATPPGPPQS